MSAPRGTGKYLLLRDYGMEGWSVQRFETLEDLKRALLDGIGDPVLLAKELTIEIKEAQ